MNRSALTDYYYEIAPASARYQARQPLTYSYGQPLVIGQVVRISLLKQSVLGVVAKTVSQPEFKTKPISAILDKVILTPVQMELLAWMRTYYPGPLGLLTGHFVPSVLNSLDMDAVKADKPTEAAKPAKLPILTAEQTAALKQINGSKVSRSFLLHGETGSGKTRIYIEATKQQLAAGKSVLILTPEIALTQPLVNQFQAALGDKSVLVMHSNLTPKQKRQIYQQLLNATEPQVIIGPRSALFAPINKLGLVVVDESHDQAYKQDSSPYYHALRVSAKLAAIADAKVVFGSATPSVSEYFLAEQKTIPILRLSKPAKSLPTQPSQPIVVNMTDKSELSNHPLLSRRLLGEIDLALRQKSQILIFLNKRGSARVVLCQNCGWHSKCSRCDNALTYHQDSHKLQCHTCGYTTGVPGACPDCSDSDILFKSPGTKAIADALSKLHPEATVARFDKDNKKDERLEQNYADLTSGKVDIMVGTQILSKGHDLPHLGLVAMLAADSALAFPDYTSEEKAYQLIYQLKGRINRGHRQGKFLLQTYQPDNQMIKQALSSNWHDFYNAQLTQRRKLHFPPYAHALKLEAHRATQDGARAAITKLADELAAQPKVRLIGPSPSFVERQAGKYRWQLIVLSSDRERLVEISQSAPAAIRANLDPIHFL